MKGKKVLSGIMSAVMLTGVCAGFPAAQADAEGDYDKVCLLYTSIDKR